MAILSRVGFLLLSLTAVYTSAQNTNGTAVVTNSQNQTSNNATNPSVSNVTNQTSTSTSTQQTNTLRSTVPINANHCPKQQFGRCEKDGDCADFNGNPLQCIEGVCTCPPDVDCKDTPKNQSLPLFADCTKTHQCVSGYGYYPGSQSDCAERIQCMDVIAVSKNAPVLSFCHTCRSCRKQSTESSGSQRFNCSLICTAADIEDDVNDTVIPEVEPLDKLDGLTKEDTKSIGVSSIASMSVLLTTLIAAFILNI